MPPPSTVPGTSRGSIGITKGFCVYCTGTTRSVLASDGPNGPPESIKCQTGVSVPSSSGAWIVKLKVYSAPGRTCVPAGSATPCASGGLTTVGSLPRSNRIAGSSAARLAPARRTSVHGVPPVFLTVTVT